MWTIWMWKNKLYQAISGLFKETGSVTVEVKSLDQDLMGDGIQLCITTWRTVSLMFECLLSFRIGVQSGKKPSRMLNLV